MFSTSLKFSNVVLQMLTQKIKLEWERYLLLSDEIFFFSPSYEFGASDAAFYCDTIYWLNSQLDIKKMLMLPLAF